jgi:TolA-binding protein
VLIAISAEEYYRKAANLRSQGLVEQCEALLRRAINMQTIVIDEFPTSDEVPHARCWMGRYYRELGDYQSSINMFQRVVDQHPDFVFVWEAYYCVGINYESLVEKGLLDSSEAEAKIRAAYQHLLASYPDCPRAEYARDWVSQHGAQ